jgi:hypothetical protein
MKLYTFDKSIKALKTNKENAISKDVRDFQWDLGLFA